MAIINYKLTPAGGEVDKYKVTLYNGTGVTALDSKVFVPPFPSEINDSFTGVIGGSTYKVGTTQYIGSITQECPLKTIVANGNVASFVINFGFTDLDTTGATPTLQNYIDSVQAIINTGMASQDTVPLGGNVSVNEFGNPSDKVLFVVVPNSENAFTKWSEVGNVFQQNIPIDTDFDSGTNPIFSTVVGGNTFYITRAQTDFAGALVLSR